MGIMIKIDTREIKRLERDLKEFNRRALPFATKNTVNGAAFAAQKTSRLNVGGSMVLRNKFTKRGILVDPARTLNIPRQEAVVGSIADYMEDQEFGGTKVSKGRRGTPIPTSFSAGQSESSRPRRKLPRRANKLENIRLKRNRLKGGRRQKNLVAVKQAAKSGSKYVYLDLGRRKGIFKVTGGKRNPRVKMIYDLTRKAITVPRNPWLVPAVVATEPKIPGLYKKSLEFQLKRLGVFRG